MVKPKGRNAFWFVLAFLALPTGSFLGSRVSFINEGIDGQTISVKIEALVTQVAPGELLPVTVELQNFGNRERVDVLLIFQIKNTQDKVVMSKTKTVAVETTASFVEPLLIPEKTAPGMYTASVAITYEGQKQPAVSTFTFSVKRKIAGLFIEQIINFLLIVLVVAVASIAVSRKMRRCRLICETPIKRKK